MTYSIVIFLIALLFWHEQNTYFGWNRLPQSEAELICDGVVMLILALSAVAAAATAK